MQRAAAAGARLLLRLDDDLLAQQMRWQVAAIGAADLNPLGFDNSVGVLRTGVFGAMLRLDVLQSQLDLFVADAL